MVITTRMRSALLWVGVWLLILDFIFLVITAVFCGLYFRDDGGGGDEEILHICFVVFFAFCVLMDIFMIVGVARACRTPKLGPDLLVVAGDHSPGYCAEQQPRARPAPAHAQYIPALIMIWLIGTAIRGIAALAIPIFAFVTVPTAYFIIIGVFILLSFILIVVLMYLGSVFFTRVKAQKDRGDSEVNPDTGPRKYDVPDNVVVVVVDNRGDRSGKGRRKKR